MSWQIVWFPGKYLGNSQMYNIYSNTEKKDLELAFIKQQLNLERGSMYYL